MSYLRGKNGRGWVGMALKKEPDARYSFIVETPTFGWARSEDWDTQLRGLLISRGLVTKLVEYGL